MDSSGYLINYLMKRHIRDHNLYLLIPILSNAVFMNKI